MTFYPNVTPTELSIIKLNISVFNPVRDLILVTKNSNERKIPLGMTFKLDLYKHIFHHNQFQKHSKNLNILR